MLITAQSLYIIICKHSLGFLLFALNIKGTMLLLLPNAMEVHQKVTSGPVYSRAWVMASKNEFAMCSFESLPTISVILDCKAY